MLNKQEVKVFTFNENNKPIRVEVVNGEPWFVAKDLCDILELNDVRRAVEPLDDDEKLSGELLQSGQLRSMWLVNESGMYTLIIRSRKPEAKKFRKWVTSEVLPSIRKKGYYGVRKSSLDYLDVRDVPYRVMSYRGGDVRAVEYGGELWYSLNDIHSCIGARTESSQSVRRLNAKQVLARKFWIYGVPNPGWFVKELGVRLLLCASLKNRESTQLMLDFEGKEGA